MAYHNKGAQFRAMKMLGLDLTKEERRKIKVEYEPAPIGTSTMERVTVGEDGQITIYTSEVE